MAKEKDPVKDAMAELKKKYGREVVIQPDDEPISVEAISTGCFAIDKLLGCGGLPRGRIIEIYGEPSSGKTATTLFFIGQIQKQGGKCAFLDAEYAFNNDFATNLGVDVKKLLMAQPTSLEEAMDIVRALVETNTIDLIVVDSVAALVPQREIDGEEMLKDSVADQARLMNKALRILTGSVARSKTIVIFINHLKEKIGVFWGDKTTTPGGKALKFYASVRLSIARSERIKGVKDEQIGSWIRVTAVKNKVGYPYRKGEFELYYKDGVDLYGDALDTAVELGLVLKEGNTYEYKGKLGVGRDASKEALKEAPELYQDLRKEIEAYIKAEGSSGNGDADKKAA